jgi:hypothetical protein
MNLALIILSRSYSCDWVYLDALVYLGNDPNPIWSGVIWGSC